MTYQIRMQLILTLFTVWAVDGYSAAIKHVGLSNKQVFKDFITPALESKGVAWNPLAPQQQNLMACIAYYLSEALTTETENEPVDV